MLSFSQEFQDITKSMIILKGNISNTNKGIVTQTKSRMWTRNLIWAGSEPKKLWGNGVNKKVIEIL